MLAPPRHICRDARLPTRGCFWNVVAGKIFCPRVVGPRQTCFACRFCENNIYNKGPYFEWDWMFIPKSHQSDSRPDQQIHTCVTWQALTDAQMMCQCCLAAPLLPRCARTYTHKDTQTAAVHASVVMIFKKINIYRKLKCTLALGVNCWKVMNY